MLRHVKKQSWQKIAPQIVNIRGGTPSWVTVRDTVQGLDKTTGRRHFHYSRCGRRPWKMTLDVQKFLIRRLVSRRASQMVTSVTLQADLAAEKGVVVETSTIRKLLKRKNYKWLPRNQKRKYSRGQKAARVAFASAVLPMSPAALRAKLSMSLDGVVLSMPPATETERYNYCWGAASHMWRKTQRATCPASQAPTTTTSKCRSTGLSRCGEAFHKMVLRQYSGTLTRRQTRWSGPRQCAMARSPRRFAC